MRRGKGLGYYTFPIVAILLLSLTVACKKYFYTINDNTQNIYKIDNCNGNKCKTNKPIKTSPTKPKKRNIDITFENEFNANLKGELSFDNKIYSLTLPNLFSRPPKCCEDNKIPIPTQNIINNNSKNAYFLEHLAEICIILSILLWTAIDRIKSFISIDFLQEIYFIKINDRMNNIFIKYLQKMQDVKYLEGSLGSMYTPTLFWAMFVCVVDNILNAIYIASDKLQPAINNFFQPYIITPIIIIVGIYIIIQISTIMICIIYSHVHSTEDYEKLSSEEFLSFEYKNATTYGVIAIYYYIVLLIILFSNIDIIFNPINITLTLTIPAIVICIIYLCIRYFWKKLRAAKKIDLITPDSLFICFSIFSFMSIVGIMRYKDLYLYLFHIAMLPALMILIFIFHKLKYRKIIDYIITISYSHLIKTILVDVLTKEDLENMNNELKH